MHWHPNAGEWSFIRGRARVTVFAAESMASIFDYGPGDVDIVPKNMGHFVEKIATRRLRCSESLGLMSLGTFRCSSDSARRRRSWCVVHLFADDEENAKKFLESIYPESDPIRMVTLMILQYELLKYRNDSTWD
ncbi:hypothetical protein VdG1_04017 [Verticillium dahliae VDG1]|nr:hypothetical protein VdG1_04017 [Verticillium dahliae VDG1]